MKVNKPAAPHKMRGNTKLSIPLLLSVRGSRESLFHPCHLCGPAVLGILVTPGAPCIPGSPRARADPVERTHIQFPQLIAMNEHFQSHCFGNYTFHSQRAMIFREHYMPTTICCLRSPNVISGKKEFIEFKGKKYYM